jgi:hypothetical protein
LTTKRPAAGPKPRKAPWTTSRRRFGYRAIGRAIFLKDTRIGLLDPKDDHVFHPVGYLKNNTMDDVIGGGA